MHYDTLVLVKDVLQNRGMLQRLLSMLLALAVAFSVAGCTEVKSAQPEAVRQQSASQQTFSGEGTSANNAQGALASDGSLQGELPKYSGAPYVEINRGKAAFTAEEIKQETFEYYAPLDALGRATQAFALVSDDTRPANGEKRKSISNVRPSGWHQAQYDCVPGKSLYNRSHLIAWSLSDENANESNLITGTTFMNQDVMQNFELQILSYIRNTGKHVLVRVTPKFEGNNLVASGVHYEAQSVEDAGAAINFNVYIFNVQPGIEIDYATGASRAAE